MNPSPVTRLAQTYIVGRDMVPAARVSSVARDLAIAVCSGCDHLAGEQLIGIIEPAPSLDEHFYGGVVTDHALVWQELNRSTKRNFTAVLKWPEVRRTSIEKSLLLGDSAKVELVDGRVLGFGATYVCLTPLMDAIAAVAPENRWFPPQPPATPSETDPTGALGALSNAIAVDPRHDVLQRLVHEGVVRGLLPLERGRELAVRASLLHRNNFFGRGFRERGWISPLPPADLLTAFGMTLGRSHAWGGEGGESYADFPIPRPLLERTAVGPDDLLVRGSPRYTRSCLGVATWVTGVRVRATAREGYTTFAIDAAAGSSLRDVNPALFVLVVDRLAETEGLLLLLRTLFGAEGEASALLSVPATETAARARSVLGDVNLRPLGVRV
jgi:hypothetical protein